MALHWLDTNIFIESKNRAYAFDLAPGFWNWIQKLADDGIVRCPKMVFDEVYERKDHLANWLSMMKKKSLFVSADGAVVKAHAAITAYAVTNYSRDKADFFMKGADAWIVAHASCCSGTVVTAESGFKGKIQIPEICRQFGVDCSDLYQLGRAHGLKLVLDTTK